MGAVYSVDRYVRTPEEVVESPFHNPAEERPKCTRPRPCQKRMRAVLNHTNSDGLEIDGRAAVFGWMAEEMNSRHAESDKPLVCIMDGEENLWEMREILVAGRTQLGGSHGRAAGCSEGRSPAGG